MAPETRIEIRMYHVGFGDAFRVTVRRGERAWRMLVDCGVHFLSPARPIEQSVAAIIADLAVDCGGTPRLDVVVATHRHQDHVSGFESERWRGVEVAEVWLPYVEDDADEDTVKLSETVSLKASARALTSLISLRREAPNINGAARDSLTLAHSLAMNSTEDSAAMDRLLEQNGSGFAGPVTTRRFLPEKTSENNGITFEKFGIVAHILGPSRDPAMIAKMRPPAKAGWLTLSDDSFEDVSSNPPAALFDSTFRITQPDESTRAVKDLQLASLALDENSLLAAASLLDRSINNTSLFFVLEVAGLKFVFPGDAQVGAWNHVRQNPAWKALVRDAAFYKVGHHGSHNATSPTFVDDEWQRSGDAMVPWRLVERWTKIPYQPLMTDLAAHGHRIITPIAADDEQPDVTGGGKLDRDPNGLWSQLTFDVG